MCWSLSSIALDLWVISSASALAALALMILTLRERVRALEVITAVMLCLLPVIQWAAFAASIHNIAEAWRMRT